MKITNNDLEALIESLEEFKRNGVIDPWVFEDGTKVEPLDVLYELRELRHAGQSCSCKEPHISDRITHCYDGKPCYVKPL